ncbi:MAG: S41 family peptidase [Thermomicrobiales bacterium]|nr:S41 family peptidase [Thermomicrobiales bacterium]
MTTQPGFVTLQTVWDLIQDEFVDPDLVDEQSLLYGAARGIVDSLGDTGHSGFLDPDEAKVFKASLDGELIGLGISIEYREREPVIVAPIRNSPAEAAGLQSEDVIVEIDGVPTLGMSDGEVSRRLRGDEGTPVTLTIDRDGAAGLLEITVVRGRIDIDPVTWALLPDGIALVQLHEFSAGSGQELRGVLQSLNDRGDIQGIVLDLRNNPGGYVTEAITVASQFLPEGKTIYLQQTRDGADEPIATIGHDGAALDTPIVVLVNRASASAAEIIAGALRDNGRAIVVGERTYGTGTIVSTFNLEGGSALALGTSFWKTPDGDLVWKTGLEPDLEIRQPASAMVEIDDAGQMTAAELDSTGDLQLLAALDALHGRENAVPDMFGSNA